MARSGRPAALHLSGTRSASHTLTRLLFTRRSCDFAQDRLSPSLRLRLRLSRGRGEDSELLCDVYGGILLTEYEAVQLASFDFDSVFCPGGVSAADGRKAAVEHDGNRTAEEPARPAKHRTQDHISAVPTNPGY